MIQQVATVDCDTGSDVYPRHHHSFVYGHIIIKIILICQSLYFLSIGMQMIADMRKIHHLGLLNP